MEDKAIHTKFWDAFKKVSEADKEFPPDVLLKFYALYKQATQENTFSYQEGEHELVSAFKMNALLQVKSLSANQAKKAYIKLAKEYLKD